MMIVLAMVPAIVLAVLAWGLSAQAAITMCAMVARIAADVAPPPSGHRDPLGRCRRSTWVGRHRWGASRGNE